MQWTNTYLDLGDAFYSIGKPRSFIAPSLLFWNEALAKDLGIPDSLRNDKNWQALIFSGKEAPSGSPIISLAYAGHQFGHFVPSLGDGRAHLLGQLKNASGTLIDVQLKGSGRTDFSRGGDGLCGIGPAIREYLMSEALHGLGVPTSRSLAVVGTGETIWREGQTPGAVVTRTALSHIRVGTFQYFAARELTDELKVLLDFCIRLLCPELSSAPTDEKICGFLETVLKKQTHLICEWMRVGFIHGVMNTDNTAISGETIDYGPCAMLGNYNLSTVYSSIDTQGRYAFGNQATIMLWNCTRLAECCVPLFSGGPEQAVEQLTELLKNAQRQLSNALGKMHTQKLGLEPANAEHVELSKTLFKELEKLSIDYTNTFDWLTRDVLSPNINPNLHDRLGQTYTVWKEYIERSQNDPAEIFTQMRKNNPVIIPRNEVVEKIITECSESFSAEPAAEFLASFKNPYSDDVIRTELREENAKFDASYRTFCGT